MKQLLRWTITGMLLLIVSACGGNPTDSNNDSSGATSDSQIGQTAPDESGDAAPATPSPDQSTEATTSTSPTADEAASQALTDSSDPTSKIAANSAQTQEVTVYRLDNQCENYVSQKITVPKADATNQIVGKVIENSNSPDFKIDNYRVRIEDRTATIDLRLPPDAKRPFAAMSTCEQRSLLGSMQKTLTSDPNLRIQSVRFTDGKEELMF